MAYGAPWGIVFLPSCIFAHYLPSPEPYAARPSKCRILHQHPYLCRLIAWPGVCLVLGTDPVDWIPWGKPMKLHRDRTRHGSRWRPQDRPFQLADGTK
ncbi:hypothetical protein B0O99DRAFT_184485 [Bisporella sp. PMI_857]|nr:hypothetical protein B0O99DRAFT_184485 [Bisporella sp. PMI_857]